MQVPYKVGYVRAQRMQRLPLEHSLALEWLLLETLPLYLTGERTEAMETGRLTHSLETFFLATWLCSKHITMGPPILHPERLAPLQVDLSDRDYSRFVIHLSAMKTAG